MAPTFAWGAEAQAKTARVGIVYDGTTDPFAGVLDLVKEEILSITAGEHEVVFPENQQINGNFDVS